MSWSVPYDSTSRMGSSDHSGNCSRSGCATARDWCRPRRHAILGRLAIASSLRAGAFDSRCPRRPLRSHRKGAPLDIVLVPGLWLDGASWDEVVPHLQAAGRRTHPLTLPGMESLDADRSGITLDDHVAAVVAAIDAADGPVVLVGHSAGAGIASAAVDARPDHVARAIYVGGFPESRRHHAHQRVRGRERRGCPCRTSASSRMTTSGISIRPRSGRAPSHPPSRWSTASCTWATSAAGTCRSPRSARSTPPPTSRSGSPAASHRCRSSPASSM